MAWATSTSASDCWARAGVAERRRRSTPTARTSPSAAGAAPGGRPQRCIAFPSTTSSPFGERPQIANQLADLVVGQVIAEGGHAGLAQRGAAVPDQHDEILVA